MEDPTLHYNFKGHKKAITGLSFHPDNAQFVTSSQDKTIMMWNTVKKSKCYCLSGHDDVVNCVDFASNGSVFASGSQDQTVRIWVPSVRGGCQHFRGHTSAIKTISISPDCDKIVTGSNDKSIKVWDLKTRHFLFSLTGHNNWVRSVKHSEQNDLLASCSDDKTLRIWDLKSGQPIHVFADIKGTGCNLSIHPGGNSIALALSSGSVRVYDIRAKKLQQHYVLHTETTGVVWHPKANYLLTSGADGIMRIVDVMEGRPLYTLEAHEGPINAIAFSPNGELFASGGSDNHVNVWKIKLI